MPRPRLLALLALLLLPLIVFHRPLLLGEAFVPADQLSYLYPWKAVNPPTEASPPWNVLRFDGITQFYPWRVEAARQVKAGRLPVRNEHQFAAHGGTPLLANSQSAPLYPPHVLFYLAPLRAIWYVFGLVSALHLAIAASGLYVLLRVCGLRRGSCVLGASAWTLSAPVIAWLSLPSFLGVACWLPWLLLLIRVAHTEAGTRTGRLAILGAGGVAGTLILAGHLQIALYALLAALLYAAFWGVAAFGAGHVSLPHWLGGVALVAGLAVGFAAPQVLPAVELSRISHRAVTEKTLALYNANNGSALPPRAFVTALVPDFYGHPNRGLHWNNSNLRDASGRSGNNFAEWAMYAGVLPLLLALCSLCLPVSRTAPPAPAAEDGGRPSAHLDKVFFAVLALLALLIAAGTPLNLALFYVIPGYASLANPGRVLTVFAFAVAALAAFGMEALLDPTIPATAKRRGMLIALAVAVLLAAWGASLGAAWAKEAVPSAPFGDIMAQTAPALLAAAVLLAISATLMAALAPRSAGNAARERGTIAAAILLTVADLALWGYGYNPSAKPEQVFPVTPGIAWLQKNAADARIAVINRDWTLGQTAPEHAVLPPNTLTVYGLHDISGYDSLFPKTAKDQVRSAGNGEDSSPPANGNMVFVKRIETALNLGADFIVLAGDAGVTESNLAEAYRGDDLVILRAAPGEADAGRRKETERPLPASLRTGFALAFAAAAVFLAILAWTLSRRSHKREDVAA